jgi:hypothetical protein
MEFGPDGYPISSRSIIIGPPLTGPAPVSVALTEPVERPPVRAPAPVPATITETIIEPLRYGTGVIPAIVNGPYAVAVLDEGTEITNRATTLNFVGATVTATSGDGFVTIVVNDPPDYNFIAGTGISINTTGNNVTITNTLPNYVFTAGDGIEVDVTGNNVTITNTLIDTVFEGTGISGSFTPDLNNGTIQKFVLTGNVTLNPPANMGAGQSMTLIFTQDTTGGHLLDANTAYLFASGFQTLSTSSGAIDMLNIFSDGSTYYTTLTVDYS